VGPFDGMVPTIRVLLDVVMRFERSQVHGAAPEQRRGDKSEVIQADLGAITVDVS